MATLWLSPLTIHKRLSYLSHPNPTPLKIPKYSYYYYSYSHTPLPILSPTCTMNECPNFSIIIHTLQQRVSTWLQNHNMDSTWLSSPPLMLPLHTLSNGSCSGVFAMATCELGLRVDFSFRVCWVMAEFAHRMWHVCVGTSFHLSIE